jgi:hypothetical protein
MAVTLILTRDAAGLLPPPAGAARRWVRPLLAPDPPDQGHSGDPVPLFLRTPIPVKCRLPVGSSTFHPFRDFLTAMDTVSDIRASA